MYSFFLKCQDISVVTGKENSILESISPQYTAPPMELVALQGLAKPYRINSQISINANTATGHDERGHAQSPSFSIARARGVSEVY